MKLSAFKKHVAALPADYDDLELFAVESASGVSSEVNTFHVSNSSEDDIGPLCDLPEGTAYLCLSVGN